MGLRGTGLGRRVVIVVLQLLLPLPWLAWAIVRSFDLERGYPAVELIALTPYVALSSLVPLGVLIWRRQWAASGLAAVAVTLFAIAIAPRALNGQPSDYEGGRGLTILTLNFELGADDAEQVVELIRNEAVDALALVQLTSEGEARLKAAGLSEVLPHRWPRGSVSSKVFSSLPLSGIDAPLSTDSGADMIGARARISGYGEVELWAVHAIDPTSAERAEAWRLTLDRLATLGGPEVPRVLAGDFNATLDHAELRDVIDAGYVDAADAVGAGLKPTFPVHGGRTPPITIDHVLVDERVEVDSTSVISLPNADHRAVLAELTLPPRER